MMLLGLIPGGKAEGRSPSEFDPVQLAIGTRVELEHTNDPAIAQEIAMDHLVEDPAYYTKLRQVHLDGLPSKFGWLAVLGLGTLAGVAAALVARKGRGLGEIRNRRDVHPAVEAQIDDAERRARAAGATGELDYIGAGVEGIVFCDTKGHAFKVGRGTRGDQGMRDEAEWLAMAAKISNIKQHVPKFFRYDPDNDVIVRECLVPKESREYRRKPRKLWELHHRVANVMATYGYGRPEFKDDSWVLTRRGPVLVDAGFAIRSGNPLVRDALDVANGRKKLQKIDVQQLAWDLQHERDKTIPAVVANKLLKRLQAIEPSIEI